jgi:hypothetical protein
MTADVADVYMEMVAEVDKLARQMVYLEEAATAAYERRLWMIVGELHEQRSEVQAYRSELLRLVWAHRWRRRRQGYFEP